MGKSGILYIMTTSVTGLIKIGKTDDFKRRMMVLEQNGYWNVSGLHPFYAVKVKNYDAKEKLIHTIFSKSQVADSELFALDKNVAKAMLESFDGEQIYPDTAQSNGKTVSAATPKAARLTFKMVGIPVGSILEYVVDPSVTCQTVNEESLVSYQGNNYKLSALVSHLKNGGSWQGGEYFMYQGKKLTKIRKDIGL